MSDLQNQTPANTYKGLLQIGDYTNGVDANAEYIQDGGGNPSALSISTTKVGVGTASPSAITTIEGEGSDSPMEGSHLLDIKSTGNSKLADIRFEAQNSSGTTRAGGVGFDPDDNAVYLANNGTQVLSVNQNENVGIGTTSIDAFTGFFGNATNLTMGGTKPSEIELGFNAQAYNNNFTGVGGVAFLNHSNGSASVDPNSIFVAGVYCHTVSANANSNPSQNAGGRLRFLTKAVNGTPAETMRLDEDGKLGIGTTDPSARLEVKTRSTDDLVVRLRSDNDNSLLDIRKHDNGNTEFLNTYYDASAGGVSGGFLFRTASNSDSTAKTTHMTINEDGKVGINQSGTLGATLQVDATDNSASALAFWVRDVAKTNSIISAYENGDVNLGSFSYKDASGNLGLGNVTTFGTNATNTIAFKEGVEPTSSPPNLVQLFCAEESNFAELRVRDEQGNTKTLSPHAKDAPSSLYDRPPGVEEMHRNANHYLGTITFTNVDRRNDLLQKQLNGEELPEDRTFTITETFAEYNARTGSDLQVEDWDANQQAMADADESYVKKPKPDWLS